MAGVTLSGFQIKTLPELKAELEAAFRASFGESIDLSPQSNFGQIIGVMAERYSDLWEASEGVWLAFSPDGAVGISLDNIAAITGTVREPAKSSTVRFTATGTPGTSLATGRVASVNGYRFASTLPVVIAVVPAWTPSTAYAFGARVRNASPSKVYQCLAAGVSAASGGPVGTGTAGDGTTIWIYLGEGTGAIDVDAVAEQTGPLAAPAGTLRTIETPVSGWAGVYNIADAVLGQDLESDAALRVRREDELRGNGRATPESLRAAVLQVNGVTAATVFENVGDTTDGNGVPPHAFEILVLGGVDADVRAAIWAFKPAGIATFGGVTGTIVDSTGASHPINFSRPTIKPIWIIVNATVDAALWPLDGVAQVKAAIAAWGDLQRTGKDAVASGVSAQVFKVPGLLDATVLIGLSNPPVSSATVAIGTRELATYDTGRITVNVTPGTP